MQERETNHSKPESYEVDIFVLRVYQGYERKKDREKRVQVILTLGDREIQHDIPLRLLRPSGAVEPVKEGARYLARVTLAAGTKSGMRLSNFRHLPKPIKRS